MKTHSATTVDPTHRRRIVVGCAALLAATVVWLPCLPLLYRRRLSPQSAIPTQAQQLAARHLRLWTDPILREEAIQGMRATNAEWDFMGRTFFVLSLADMALRGPERTEELLAVMDAIIDETLRLDAERGMWHFLMSYARRGQYLKKPVSSQFVDGEIALMLAVRRLVREKPAYRPPLAERVDRMVHKMRQSPILYAESYPDECWTFDNTIALTAIRMADVLDGTDHAAFTAEWLATARRHVVDPQTGLLVSSITVRGQPIDGPEGTTIWSAAHFLQFVDEDFAADQYRRARAELAGDILGFGYSREWPASWQGPLDVDSGPIVPLLDASASASGLAIVGAHAFSDRAYASRLLAALDYTGLPIREGGTLRYAAGNPVGDAVILYGLVLGPVRDKVKEGAGR
jgi:hypothetical protein